MSANVRKCPYSADKKRGKNKVNQAHYKIK